MTTDARTLTFDSSTDALFRAWGSGLSAAFQAAGLVQTTDTGQVNWSTVTRLTTILTEAINGYEIYRFNDSLQATKPVFIKVEYGTVNGNPSISSPVIAVTLGTATNGAGALSGVIVSARTKFVTNVIVSGVTGTTPSSSSPCYTSGDGSSVVMALGVTSAAQPLYNGTNNVVSGLPAFLVIERSRDASGVITGDGAILATCRWPTNSGQASGTYVLTPTFQMISFTGSGVGVQDVFWPILMPGTAFNSGSVSGNLYTWPLPVATPKAQGQSLAVLGIYKTDVALGSTLSLTVSGSTHTYLSLASIAGAANNDAARGYVNPNLTTGAILMRYE